MPDPSARTARLRPVPLMTPAVTLGSLLPSMKPNGFPMAIAHSPTTRSLELPSLTTGRLRPSILRTARSFSVSAPRRRAGNVVPSGRATEIRVAPTTTCALVMTMPSARVMNPEPSPGRTRVPPRPPKKSNGSTGPRSTVSVCTVTTAGATCATASVMAVRRDSAIELPVCAARASRTSVLLVSSSRCWHAWTAIAHTTIDGINRTSHPRPAARDSLAPVVEELIHSAVGERVHEHVAKHGRRNRRGVGARTRAPDEMQRRSQRRREDLALESVVREDLARLRNDRHAVLPDVLEAADEGTHVARAGFGGEKRLRRCEDERRAHANSFRGEPACGDDTVLQHRDHHDDAVGDLREVTALAVDAIGIDRHHLRRDRSSHRSRNLGEMVPRVGLRVFLREQRRVGRHAIDEARARGPDDLGERCGVEEDLHSAVR